MDEQREQRKDEHRPEPTGDLADTELEQAAGGLAPIDLNLLGFRAQVDTSPIRLD